MKVEERNSNAKYYVNAKIRHVKELNDNDFLNFQANSDIHNMLTDLIEVNAKGFRGVVLTSIVGMQLNPEYNPLTNFYDCNPRAIFEEGIWYALTENNIPCGKSDPLNVAKNINKLDEGWAEGRRPQKSAMAAINFLRIVTEYKGKQREELIDYFFYRLNKYAESLSDFNIVKGETKGATNRQYSKKLVDFILNYPEAGAVPQYLVGKIMEAIYSSSDINVIGGNESVFGTNTTSKKPADIWTELAGQPLNLYEITVKKVNAKRLDDCIGSLHSVGCLNNPVTFICRLPDDAAELELVDGAINYKGKTFDFIDISEFIISSCVLLLPDQLQEIIAELEVLISDVNISIKTKKGWNEIFNENTANK